MPVSSINERGHGKSIRHHISPIYVLHLGYVNINVKWYFDQTFKNSTVRRKKGKYSFYRKIEIVNLAIKGIDHAHTSSTLLRPTHLSTTNSSLYSCSDVQAIGANEKGADKERFHGHDDHVLLVAEPPAGQSTGKSRHGVHDGAGEPGLRENPRQRGKLQLRVRRPPREPRSRWTGDAVGRPGAPRRGVSGNDAGGDRRPFRGRLASTGRPPRNQIPVERLLQTELRAGNHQASERGISRGGEQRGRGGGATILGIPVRSTGRQHLTEHRAPAKDQLEDGALPSTRPRPRVTSSEGTIIQKTAFTNDRCFLPSLRTKKSPRSFGLKLSSFQMGWLRNFVDPSVRDNRVYLITHSGYSAAPPSPPPFL